MILRFLGTGPAAAIPRAGHTDAACVDARREGSKSRRRRSSALVSTRSTTILIDVGPDVLEQLAEACLRKIDAVLLTHVHADATGGLPLLNRWVEDRCFSTKLPILTDRKTAAWLVEYYPHLEYLQFVIIKSFDRVRIGDLHILPFAVEHGDVPCFGYTFGNAFAYASDMSGMPSASAKALRRVGTLILDGAFYFHQKKLQKHFTTDEAIAWAVAHGAKDVVLTQIGHTYPPHRVAERELRAYLTRENITGLRVRLAYDGMKRRFT
ncbi:MBL fold metallo-hydrolase [Candidatus Uhrbacteria bacterium]|nr:MAG: MBL fold metallo-hydrolase [Candidatus Uhrbacteria bacterium]